MDQYFTQMEKVVAEKKTSSRVRFMLQDVIELRLVRTRIMLSVFSRPICGDHFVCLAIILLWWSH